MGTRSIRSAKKCQLGQRQYQRYWGYHSKKLRSHQDGRMKLHLPNFMIGQFQRIFKTIYLDEMCRLLYVYMVLLILQTYMVLIIHETILIRLRKTLDY